MGLFVLVRLSSDVEILYAAADTRRLNSNKSETALFRGEELFSALHHSGEVTVNILYS